jgi:hypothetical protein
MKNIFFTSVFICLSIVAEGQYISHITYPDTSHAIVSDMNDVAVKLSSEITASDIQAHLEILASDEFEGRETGTKGNQLAANYIAEQFQKIGLPNIGDNNTVFQNVAFTTVKWKETAMYISGVKYKHLWDYLAFPSKNHGIPFIGATEIVFAGYGIASEKYNDYKKVDVQDKVVMVYAGEPISQDSISWVTGTKNLSEWSTNVELKTSLAKSKGAKLLIIIENDMKKMLMENRRFLVGSRVLLGNQMNIDESLLNHIYVSPQTASVIWGDKKAKALKSRDKIKKSGKSSSFSFGRNFAIKMDKSATVIEGENVMGFIEGSDKKDEVVVISAHYDHLGIRGDDIYNGADDNGSGTSTVLDIAAAFKKAKDMGVGPRRSVLCLLVTGEEKGLLGSDYYSENPVFPLESTVANINVDMIGRVDKDHADNPNYIYVIGSDRLSTDLHNINEDMNQKYAQLELNYTFNSESDPNQFYYRSDHYNFAKKGIPAIFYFSGAHKDYHRTTDTVEKIMFDKVEKIGRLIFHTAWEIANREERIVVDGLVE